MAKATRGTRRISQAGIDEAIRRRARLENKSLNRVAIDALMEAFGLSGERPGRALQRFLSRDGVETVFADGGTTRHYANLSLDGWTREST